MGEKTVACRMCRKALKNDWALSRHVLAVHPDAAPVRGTVSCRACHAPLKSVNGLSNHRAQKHPELEPDTCSVIVEHEEDGTPVYCDKPRAKAAGGRRSKCASHSGRLYSHRDVFANVPIGSLGQLARRGLGTVDSKGYLKDRRPDHPLAQADGQVFRHRAVLYDEIGSGTHPCHWCTRTVSWTDAHPIGLQVDHLDGDTLNNDPSNLVPACGDCNGRRAVAGNPIDWKPAPA